MEKFYIPHNLLIVTLQYLDQQKHCDVVGLIQALKELEKAPSATPDLKAVEAQKPVS